MNSEEKFKQSLKSLVESKEFVFDDKDWDKAAAYMAEKRAGAKGARIGLLILAVAGLVGTSIMMLIPETSDKKATAQIATVETPVITTSHEKSLPVAPVSFKEEAPEPSSTKIAESPTRVRTSAQKNKNVYVSANSVVASEEKHAEKVAQQGEMDITISKKEKTKQREDVSRATPPPVEQISTPATKEETVPETKEIVQVATLPVTAVTVQPATEQTVENKEEVAAVETPTQAPVVTLAKKDVPDSIKAKIPRVMLLSIEAGTSYQFGWKNEGADRDAAGFNPVAGIHYMNQIDDRYSLSFGIQYQRTGHLDAFSHTSKQSRYSFGEESEVTTITPSKLHYLSVPIRVYYKLNEKNIIGGSYSIAYLLDVEASVETYTLKMGKQNNNKGYTTRGYTDGFALFDSQVAFFYRRHLYGDFFLHGEAFLGLNDVKQNNFFGGNKAQRNSGLRLMLVYGIHSRNK